MTSISQRFSSMLKWWLPFALLATLLCGLIYSVAQQAYRMSANDDLVEISRGLADSLAAGRPLSSLAPENTVDIAQSLAIYAMVYDENGTAVVSSATLHGDSVTIPSGVIDYTREHGEDRVTWQPEAGIRQAIVVNAYSNATDGSSGFVAVGRSLAEVDAHTALLLWQVLLGWFITLLSFLILSYFYAVRKMEPVVLLEETKVSALVPEEPLADVHPLS
jgi:hypothetical protein